jgi:hypothetical protein
MSYEVQTKFIYGWENVWSIEDEEGVVTSSTFKTEQEAEDAICEFFADLAAAGMHQLYDKADYRVRKIDTGAEKP